MAGATMMIGVFLLTVSGARGQMLPQTMCAPKCSAMGRVMTRLVAEIR
eukprot:COSAG06_NODE_13468_length_1254_cov_1.335931_1_plen_47_part_10